MGAVGGTFQQYPIMLKIPRYGAPTLAGELVELFFQQLTPHRAVLGQGRAGRRADVLEVVVDSVLKHFSAVYGRAQR